MGSTATVACLAIGGATVVSDTGTVVQEDAGWGNVTLGEAVAADEAVLTIGARGTWNIINNVGVVLGADTASHIVNSGLFEKTACLAASNGVSAVAALLANDGIVKAASASLDFKRVVNGKGKDIVSGSLMRPSRAASPYPCPAKAAWSISAPPRASPAPSAASTQGP